jgi:glycosyltransferase involved in cell wall biosynthesis
MDVSVILPCFNEQETLGVCIDKIKKVLPSAEIIVVDNNSTDNSVKIALSKKVKIIYEKNQGYGFALKAGFKAAKGKRVVMADADNTYDFNELPRLLKYDFDLVIGNRLNKNMKQGSMPLLHRFIGTPTLSALLKIIFKSKIKDSQSGFRVIKKEALQKMNLQSTGMELASEMIIKATNLKLSIKEVPITYNIRKGESKLNTLRDGWRHLRLILIYGPSYLFLIPGLTFLTLGFVLMVLLMIGPLQIFGLTLKSYPVMLGSLLMILGYNISFLWVFTKTYQAEYLDQKHKFINLINKYFNLEKALLLSTIIIFIGGLLLLKILFTWINTGFGELNELNLALFSLTLIILGIQSLFSSFFISILGIKNERR